MAWLKKNIEADKHFKEPNLIVDGDSSVHDSNVSEVSRQACGVARLLESKPIKLDRRVSEKMGQQANASGSLDPTVALTKLALQFDRKLPSREISAGSTALRMEQHVKEKP